MPQPINRIYLGVAAMSAASLILGGVSAAPAMAAPSSDPELKSRSSVSTAVKQAETDRFIVGFSGPAKSNAAERAKAYGKVAKESGFSVQEVKAASNGSQVIKVGKKLGASDSAELIKDLKAQPNVSYVEADTLVQTAYTPNDEHYDYQWNLSNYDYGLRIPSVWDKTTGTGQVVAVIDSGITAHSDLNANILPGYDMMSDGGMARDGNGRDSNPQDEGDWIEAGQCGYTEAVPSSWHGTHVAGSIAALGNNANGISGAAPGVKVVPVRALGTCGGYMSDIADAIIWASGGAVAGVPINQNPAKILNLSLAGWGTCSSTMQSAINSAVSRGSAVFVAAGNNGIDASNLTPANCGNTITVASSGAQGMRASYSNYGAAVDITAPGGDMWMAAEHGILSTINTGATVPDGEAYAFYQGTSMATPMAASVGALMLATNPSLTPAAMEAQLKSTTRTMPWACEEGCGAGLINANRAVDPTVVDEPQLQQLSFDQPTVMGTFEVGSTLMTYEGEWGPAPVDFAYQWFSNGEPIAGATNSSYTVKPIDLGNYIWVDVTGSKSGYKSETSGSNGDYVKQGGLLSSTPTIEGNSQLGGTVQANPGEWGPAPVNFSYQWYRNAVAIPGATNSLYAIQTDDAGKTLSVAVTGSKEGYTSKTLNSAGKPIANGVLVSQVPVITGAGTIGSVLTADAGSWFPYPITLSYQWSRNGVAITGATSYQYTPTAEDATKVITVSVTGTKSGYATKTETSAGKTIAANEIVGTKPVIGGEARVGSTVTVSPGAWGPAPVTLSYQWYRDGVAISGATGTTRVLDANDLGKVITATVTGTKAGFPTKSITSNGTAAVLAGNLTAGAPAISGTAKVGYTLSAASGTWGPAPVELKYQWFRSGVAITGATASTRVLDANDLGKVLTVQVTGSKSGYTSVAKTTAGTAAVATGTLVAPIPTITGTAKVGYTLTATAGAWTSGTTLKYQWYRSGVAITGAVASTYALTAADYAKSISVRVTGSKVGYGTAVSISKGTAAVAIGTLTAPVPVISGTAKVGYALTAVPGAWTSGTTLKYQWYRNGIAITGAVYNKYTLTATDYAKSITVRVTGSKAGYTAVTKVSKGTAAVAIGTLVAGNPTISGTARAGYVLTAKPGVWTAGTTLRYQWYRSGVAIAGATGASYKLVTADRYDTIKVRIVGSKAGYTTVTKFSASTVRIP